MTLRLIEDLQKPGKYDFLPTASTGQFAVVAKDGSGFERVLPQGTFNLVALLRASEDATGVIHVWLDLLPDYEEAHFEIDKAIAESMKLPYKAQPQAQASSATTIDL